VIKKKGKKAILYDSKGEKILGKHQSRAAALKQEKAIWASKARALKRRGNR